LSASCGKKATHERRDAASHYDAAPCPSPPCLGPHRAHRGGDEASARRRRSGSLAFWSEGCDRAVHRSLPEGGPPAASTRSMIPRDRGATFVRRRARGPPSVPSRQRIGESRGNSRRKLRAEARGLPRRRAEPRGLSIWPFKPKRAHGRAAHCFGGGRGAWGPLADTDCGRPPASGNRDGPEGEPVSWTKRRACPTRRSGALAGRRRDICAETHRGRTRTCGGLVREALAGARDRLRGVVKDQGLPDQNTKFDSYASYEEPVAKESPRTGYPQPIRPRRGGRRSSTPSFYLDPEPVLQRYGPSSVRVNARSPMGRPSSGHAPRGFRTSA